MKTVSRFFWALLAVVGLAMSLFFLIRTEAEYDDVYRRAARELVNGEDFYATNNGYVYPPFAAWLAIPVASMPVLPARAIWLVINLIAFVFLIRSAWLIAQGSSLWGKDADGREQAVFWIGFGTALIYLINAFHHTQTDIVIGALVMGGCLALTQGRSMRAAIWFGFASAFKCTPLLWLIYFVWRGRYAPALMVAALFVGANLLPNLAASGPDNRWWLTYWSERYLAGMARPTAEVGAWHTYPRYNQSLNGAMQRLFFVDPAWSDQDNDYRETPRQNTVDRQLVKFGTLAGEAGLLLGCLVLLGRFRQPSCNELPAERLRDGLDCAVICILMLLLSPMSGKAHFGTLILPGFCLGRLVLARQDRVLVGILVLSVPLIIAGRLPLRDLGVPLLRECAFYSLWWGSAMWHAILLLTACLLAQRHLKPPDQALHCNAPLEPRRAEPYGRAA